MAGIHSYEGSIGGTLARSESGMDLCDRRRDDNAVRLSRAFVQNAANRITDIG